MGLDDLKKVAALGLALGSQTSETIAQPIPKIPASDVPRHERVVPKGDLIQMSRPHLEKRLTAYSAMMLKMLEIRRSLNKIIDKADFVRKPQEELTFGERKIAFAFHQVDLLQKELYSLQSIESDGDPDADTEVIKKTWSVLDNIFASSRQIREADDDVRINGFDAYSRGIWK